MTVQEAIDKLSAIKQKDMLLYFDCSHCGRGLQMVAAKEVVLVLTEEPSASKGEEPHA